MKVLEKVYISSRKQELETLPSFLSGEHLAREIAEVIFASTDNAPEDVAVPFAVVINIYRMSPIFVKTKQGKLLVGYKYRYHHQLYIPPVVTGEIPNIPRYLLEFIQGLEEFLLPPH